MSRTQEQILKEITPLSDRDCFYIVERFKRDFDYPLHTHADCELNFIEHGAGIKRIVGDSVETIGDYDLVLITGENLIHHWSGSHQHEELSREITIQFAPGLLNENILNKNQFRTIREMISAAQTGLVFSMSAIMRIYPTLDRLSAKQGFYAVIDFISILYELSLDKRAKTLSSSAFASIPENHNSRRIQKVCNYVDTYYATNIRLDQLAELAGMTPVGLSRFFRKKTNKSISEYIIDVRIGRASRLLVYTARSISDICYECGFNNISNFNRIFKMRRGVSPSSFRDNYRKNKVII